MVARFCNHRAAEARLTNITCRETLQLFEPARDVEHCAPFLALENTTPIEEIIVAKLASCLAVTLGPKEG